MKKHHLIGAVLSAAALSAAPQAFAETYEKIRFTGVVADGGLLSAGTAVQGEFLFERPSTPLDPIQNSGGWSQYYPGLGGSIKLLFEGGGLLTSVVPHIVVSDNVDQADGVSIRTSSAQVSGMPASFPGLTGTGFLGDQVRFEMSTADTSVLTDTSVPSGNQWTRLFAGATGVRIDVLGAGFKSDIAVNITSVTAVPEPGTIGLLVGGMAVLGAVARRRTRL